MNNKIPLTIVSVYANKSVLCLISDGVEANSRGGDFVCVEERSSKQEVIHPSRTSRHSNEEDLLKNESTPSRHRSSDSSKCKPTQTTFA